MTDRDYELRLDWTGDLGDGTAHYRAYRRWFEVAGGALPVLPGSSDPLFRGDEDRWNPEQLVLAALSGCHMLWYLHLCADAGVVVRSYVDRPVGRTEAVGPGGRFAWAQLRPEVEVDDPAGVERAVALHAEAARHCLVAASVAFPVRHDPTVRAAGRTAH